LREELGRIAAAVDGAYGSATEDAHTGELNKADEDRDQSAGRFTKVVRGLQYDFDPEKADSAAMIYSVLKKHEYGKPKASHAEQTTTVRAMLSDMATDTMKAAIMKAGVQAGFDDLDRKQTVFEEVYQRKIAGKAETRELPLTTLIAPLRQGIFDILVYLNSRERLQPEQYRALNARVNELVTEAGAKAHGRKSRRDAPHVVGQENE
jgi:hypothetical protein